MGLDRRENRKPSSYMLHTDWETLERPQKHMTPGEKYIQTVSGFTGANVAEQIEITLQAQREFTEAWEKAKQENADNKKKVEFGK